MGPRRLHVSRFTRDLFNILLTCGPYNSDELLVLHPVPDDPIELGVEGVVLAYVARKPRSNVVERHARLVEKLTVLWSRLAVAY